MALLSILVSLVIWGLIFYVLWWGLAQIQLSDPWNIIATVILVLATVVIAIGILDGSIPPFNFITKILI